MNLDNRRRAASLAAAVLLAAAGWCLAPSKAAAQLDSAGALSAISELQPTRLDDLIRLATSYADVLGELRSAEMNLDTLRSLQRTTATVTALELRIAALNVQTAERKQSILQALAERELALAESRVRIIEQIDRNQADEPDDERAVSLQLAQARATVEILKKILAMK